MASGLDQPLPNLPIRDWLRRFALAWERPLWSAGLALCVYVLFAAANGSIWRSSRYAYFNYLADAFLHAQFHLRIVPPSPHDLSVVNGKYYLYWPPFPALLLIPFVALFGVGFSDIVFTLALGAVNVALVALLLRHASRRLVIKVTGVQRGLLVLCFALGTVHLTLAPLGRVWFTAQLVGFCCLALAYLATLSLTGWRSFALTGLCIAAAWLTRNHLVFAGLWPGCFLLHSHRALGWRRLLGLAMLGSAPIIVAVGLLGAYNWLRFSSPFDNGLAYHNMGPLFVGDYQRYGAFNIHYVPTNFRYQYIAYPFPLREANLMGGSLFLLTPVFFASFYALARGHPRWSVWTLFATILLIAAPILLLMGTGWIQFGPRYTLDFMVPLLLLTAIGIRRWPRWLLLLLTLVSVVHYMLGSLYLATFI